jgi:hypothetical protein
MKRLIIAAACGALAMGLSACGYDKNEYNDQAGYNADESNYSGTAANYEMPANDMNMTDMNGMNMSDGNMAGNDAAANETGY